MTYLEYRELQSTQKDHKYHAIATEVNGIRFDSKAEAARYQELLLALRGNLVSDLQLQVKFPIEVNGQKICDYVADFVYIDNKTGNKVVEDTKGVKTPAYILKKKLVKAIYGIDILEG